MVVEVILGLLVITEGYVIWNMLNKTEMLEDWVETFTQRIEKVQNDLKEIDATGHFESDDEVGMVFQQIKDTVDELETLKGEEVDAK